MAKITYEQAAHRLRMSVRLLKWFASYGVRGRKLVVIDGHIDEAEALGFDAYLRAPWPDRTVPEGISHELKREACGKCTICDAPVPLEEAHIERKGKELDHYCQHPHNLTLACPTCHTRYDQGDKLLPLDVIEVRKNLAQSRHLREVDADIAMKEAITKVVEAHAATLTRLGPSFWTTIPESMQLWKALTPVLAPVTSSISVEINDAVSVTDKITVVSSSIASSRPVSAAKLESIVDGFSTESEVWEHIEPYPREAWQCRICGDYALVAGSTCHECETIVDVQWNEVPCYVEEEDGLTVAYFENARGDSWTPECPECGHSALDFEFQEYCSYHAHMVTKLNDDS